MTRKLTKIFQQGNNCSIFQLFTKMSIKLSFLDNCRYYISAIQNINDLCLNKIAYSIEIIIKRESISLFSQNLCKFDCHRDIF